VQADIVVVGAGPGGSATAAFLAENASRYFDDESSSYAAKVFREGSGMLERAARKRPFALVLDTFEPHEPWTPPRRYVDMYGDPDYRGPEPCMARYRRVRDYLDGGTFCLTYGDGVSDVSIAELVAYHRSEGGLATLTAVRPPGRFGALTLRDGQSRITSFQEKPLTGDGSDEAWINGGFFVVEPAAIDYIEGDQTVWEHEPLARMAGEGKLFAYKHAGFWHPMDTLRDRMVLEEMWDTGHAPWRVWG
jgi:NDP-sugar pyrophosphorylase family protein